MANRPVEPEAVRRVLGEALPGPVAVDGIVALSGGASAETCAVDVTDATGAEHALILRRASGTNQFNPGVGKRQEALTQQAAGRAGVPVAEVLAIFETDPELGSGYLMRRLEGETIARRLLRDERFATARARIVDDCARALAAIHRVDPATLPSLPELPADRQIAQLEAMHRAFGQHVPVFSLAFRWLRENIPPPEPLKLVHGDFRTGNFLIDDNGLVAVLDWELIHLGNPVEDIGWFCAPAWRFGGKALPAASAREALYAAYETASGRRIDPAEARYWEVFATLRWGVICQFQAFAHLNRLAPSVERAAIGRRVTEVELDLLLLIEGETLMLDERPTAAELVKAVADFLEKKALAELSGHTAFHTKVSVNALRIVQRELEDGGAIDRAERARLTSLLGYGDGIELRELNGGLCRRIEDGSLPLGDAGLREYLWRSVLARIAVDSPKYPSIAAAAAPQGGAMAEVACQKNAQ